jgi:putative NADH-flavin reductase
MTSQKMKIAVIAAAGRSGMAFVEAALGAGYDVRAGIRDNNPFADNSHLEVLPCDATHIDEVRTLLAGCDAVVTLIGHVKGSPARVQTEATDVIISVMKELSIKRLVSLTGTGVRFIGDKITLLDRFANWSIGMIDPDRISDGREHVEHIKKSGLDWTIIRVLKLQNIAPKPFTLREHGPTKPFVGRQEVAQAILETLEKQTFIQKAPIIGQRV